MKSRLQQAGFWCDQEGDFEVNISLAWNILARLGFPARYGGRTQDGSHEYIITNPQTGELFATGKGMTLERSMCEAVLNANDLIDTR